MIYNAHQPVQEHCLDVALQRPSANVTGRNLSTKQLQEYDSRDVNISARGNSVTSPEFCIIKVLMFVDLQISQVLKHKQEENTVWIGVHLILAPVELLD